MQHLSRESEGMGTREWVFSLRVPPKNAASPEQGCLR